MTAAGKKIGRRHGGNAAGKGIMILSSRARAVVGRSDHANGG
jgi:hypothetical protein